MARCYELSTEQSRLWEEGDNWTTWRLEEDVLDWADTHRIHDEIIVVTAAHQIAFAITAQHR
jgi:hypothetical protein